MSRRSLTCTKIRWSGKPTVNHRFNWTAIKSVETRTKQKQNMEWWRNTIAHDHINFPAKHQKVSHHHHHHLHSYHLLLTTKFLLFTINTTQTNIHKQLSVTKLIDLLSHSSSLPLFLSIFQSDFNIFPAFISCFLSASENINVWNWIRDNTEPNFTTLIDCLTEVNQVETTLYQQSLDILTRAGNNSATKLTKIKWKM